MRDTPKPYPAPPDDQDICEELTLLQAGAAWAARGGTFTVTGRPEGQSIGKHYTWGGGPDGVSVVWWPAMTSGFADGTPLRVNGKKVHPGRSDMWLAALYEVLGLTQALPPPEGWQHSTIGSPLHFCARQGLGHSQLTGRTAEEQIALEVSVVEHNRWRRALGLQPLRAPHRPWMHTELSPHRRL